MPYNQRFADFNESTYGQLVTGEITGFLRQLGDLAGVPITPTLKNEADLGYDLGVTARWGMVYLQYKIAEYIRGRNAREYAHLNHPYFRFTVKTDVTRNGKIQHNTLCDLETNEHLRGGLVFYIAPAFLTMSELFAHLSSNNVLDQSVFAAPLQLGPVAAGAVHHYTYTSQKDVVPFSEPGPERTGDFTLMVDTLRDVLPTVDRVALPLYLNDTATVLREVTGFDASSDLPAVQQIARICFAHSLQPLLVRYEPPTEEIETRVQPQPLG